MIMSASVKLLGISDFLNYMMKTEQMIILGDLDSEESWLKQSLWVMPEKFQVILSIASDFII